MTTKNYLKIGKATDLNGMEYIGYRALEILPGFLSLGTFAFLIYLSYTKPITAAFIIIVFDVYWLLLVAYLGILLISAYRELKRNTKINWEQKCKTLKIGSNELRFNWQKVVQLIILPTYNESEKIISDSIEAIKNDSFPNKKIIIVLAIEERAGRIFLKNAHRIREKYKNVFRSFLITVHPDGIEGEIKGKGANQAWAARIAKEQIIDKYNIDYGKILVSVFDIDTVIKNGYFFCLTHRFLTTKNPYNASYQPIPVYRNNIWQAPFFARIAANSNTFWQMMQQIRQEKLATYSSHSMTFKTLVVLDFWSTNMVSEDSRIFWHALLHYNGNYRVEPLYFPVSMDVCMGEDKFTTLKNLYKQQRRWGWGAENVPYLIFNTIKRRANIKKSVLIRHILVQVYGFHSWATNAIIIALIGWMPIMIGGDSFNKLVLSKNLPFITEGLMRFAMIGLVLSAVISTLLLPKHPKKLTLISRAWMLVQWLLLPISIIALGSIPALEAQVRLMLGKYMGFWATPKER
ncbi:glycosyltransferase family 2 protein [Patescibacteria group bacterium]|nr:glycosyltransferase family 2 protein [Patescibacteria group bacterium]